MRSAVAVAPRGLGNTNVVWSIAAVPPGTVIRRFQADPTQDRIWDLKAGNGARAAAGVYLVFVRDGDRTRSFRVAVVR